MLTAKRPVLATLSKLGKPPATYRADIELGREAPHVADRPDDLRGQDGSYAEDL